MRKHELIWGGKAIPVAIRDLLSICFGKQKEKYKNLEAFKDIHKGERCFFIGTGPSLLIEDVELLKDEKVFLCNYGIALCKKLSYRPDYYMIVDPTCYQDIQEHMDMELVKTPIVVDMIDFKGGINELHDNENWIHLPGYRAFFYIERALKRKWSFSKNVAKYVFSGGSVIYFCYQLAIYMGFSEIHLLGMDCDYGKNQVHFMSVNDKTDKKLKMNAEWYNNNFLKMHECAKYNCDKNHVAVYNLTNGGNLEIFERKLLKEVLKSE